MNSVETKWVLDRILDIAESMEGLTNKADPTKGVRTRQQLARLLYEQHPPPSGNFEAQLRVMM